MQTLKSKAVNRRWQALRPRYKLDGFLDVGNQKWVFRCLDGDTRGIEEDKSL